MPTDSKIGKDMDVVRETERQRERDCQTTIMRLSKMDEER